MNEENSGAKEREVEEVKVKRDGRRDNNIKQSHVP